MTTWQNKQPWPLNYIVQQAISINLDQVLSCHMVSLGHNQFNGPQHGILMFAGSIFKHIFLGPNCSIVITISVKFVPDVSVENKLALLQIMAWCCQTTSHYLSQWCHMVALERNELTHSQMMSYDWIEYGYSWWLIYFKASSGNLNQWFHCQFKKQQKLCIFFQKYITSFICKSVNENHTLSSENHVGCLRC